MSDKMIKKSFAYLDWLAYAEEDLVLDKLALKEEQGIGPALFLTQQCAEKALKAFLAFNNHETEKVHDLVKLVKQCSRMDNTFLQLLSLADRLNPYQTKTRYPDAAFPIPFVDTLKASIDEAEQVLNFVKECVKEKS